MISENQNIVTAIVSVATHAILRKTVGNSSFHIMVTRSIDHRDLYSFTQSVGGACSVHTGENDS